MNTSNKENSPLRSERDSDLHVPEYIHEIIEHLRATEVFFINQKKKKFFS